MGNLVSIITPTYNSGKFIIDCIESVRNQTFQNWELIIVDDKSTDNTKEIVLNYIELDGRIKYHCLEINSGAAIARTKAMEIADGNFFAFLDSDDIWYKSKLEEQMKFMLEHNYVFSCTSYEQINEIGEKINKIIRPLFRANYNRVLLDCPIGNSTVMYNVDILGKFVVPNIRKRNDDALWLQLLKKEKFIYGMDKILTKYRIRKNSISSNKIQLIKYHWILYRKIEKLSIISSIFHICVWIFIKIFRLK